MSEIKKTKLRALRPTHNTLTPDPFAPPHARHTHMSQQDTTTVQALRFCVEGSGLETKHGFAWGDLRDLARNDVERFSGLHSWYKHLPEDGCEYLVVPSIGVQPKNLLHAMEENNDLHFHFVRRDPEVEAVLKEVDPAFCDDIVSSGLVVFNCHFSDFVRSQTQKDAAVACALAVLERQQQRREEEEMLTKPAARGGDGDD